GAIGGGPRPCGTRIATTLATAVYRAVGRSVCRRGGRSRTARHPRERPHRRRPRQSVAVALFLVDGGAGLHRLWHGAPAAAAPCRCRCRRHRCWCRDGGGCRHVPPW
ncbi:unnamed protein product, partial [Phaeothamnion confervicola]